MLMQLSINHRLGLTVGGGALQHLSCAGAARHDWLQQLRLMNNANEAKFLQISCASLVALVYEKSEIFIE